MGSSYQSEADAIDQEATNNLEANPELAERIDKTLPYLTLEMLLKSSSLSVNQMVIAAGSTLGIRSKIQHLVDDYLGKNLIEEIEDENEGETFYQIADKSKAESLFMEIAKN